MLPGCFIGFQAGANSHRICRRHAAPPRRLTGGAPTALAKPVLLFGGFACAFRSSGVNIFDNFRRFHVVAGAKPGKFLRLHSRTAHALVARAHCRRAVPTLESDATGRARWSVKPVVQRPYFLRESDIFCTTARTVRFPDTIVPISMLELLKAITRRNLFYASCKCVRRVRRRSRLHPYNFLSALVFPFGTLKMLLLWCRKYFYAIFIVIIVAKI